MAEVLRLYPPVSVFPPPPFCEAIFMFMFHIAVRSIAGMEIAFSGLQPSSHLSRLELLTRRLSCPV